MTISPSGHPSRSGFYTGPGRAGVLPPDPPCAPCAAWLDGFLSDSGPQRGYGHLLRQAADTGLYDVIRQWSVTDNPSPTDRLTVQLLLPPDILAEIVHETALTEQEILASLPAELPLAVRRHSTQQRFNRFGHAGCHGEDPVRR